MVAKQFGRNLFVMRGMLGMSQTELATRAQLHRTEIGLLENGKRLPRIDTLMKLVGALEADPRDLLFGIVWQPVENPSGYFHGSHWVKRPGRGRGRKRAS